MKVTAIETIRLPERPNLLLAQVHTDEGLDRAWARPRAARRRSKRRCTNWSRPICSARTRWRSRGTAGT